ncbi:MULTISPECIES: hypothetical protein [unclassified Bacteroides]|uniref:hypothetical protein n=1 Tax=unclassified Bacteroides TaxID=2646097 RepID=UPI001313F5C3|nr:MULTISPECIES: hypothetical protein [unclassified Bacteroides]
MQTEVRTDNPSNPHMSGRRLQQPAQCWLVATLGCPSGYTPVRTAKHRNGDKADRMFVKTDNSMYND